MKSQYAQFSCVFLFATALLAADGLATMHVPLLGFHSNTPGKAVLPIAEHASPASRNLFAVNQSYENRGSISVYDIDAGHRLVKIICTVSNVGDVRGVAVSAATGKLYVAYRDTAGTGMIYCLDVYTEAVLWNRAVYPDIDRLAINPNGQLIYVPTGEEGSANFINVMDANTGDVVRRIYFSNRSHDTLYPAGPIFQETKADDGSGHYLYLIVRLATPCPG